MQKLRYLLVVGPQGTVGARWFLELLSRVGTTDVHVVHVRLAYRHGVAYCQYEKELTDLMQKIQQLIF
jgi:hypothetical protein